MSADERPEDVAPEREQAPVPAPTTPLCYARVDEEVLGPLGSEELRRLIVSGRIRPETPLRTEDMPDFVPATEIIDRILPSSGGGDGRRTRSPARPAPKKSFYLDEHRYLGLIILIIMFLVAYALTLIRGD